MSHWLNHDPFAVDRHAKRHRDRQAVANLAGAGLLGAANYILGKTTYRSLFPQNNPGMPPINIRKRSRALSTYVSGHNAGRPVKRRRLNPKRKAAPSSRRTVIKKGGKGYRRTKRSRRRRRRTGKKYRKNSRKGWGLFQKLGILRTHETGVSTTGVTDAGFLGHASFRPTGLVTDFMLALLKSAYARGGIHMTNTNDTVPVPVGDGVEVYVKPNAADATNITSTGMVYVGGETWLSVAVALWTDIVASVVPGDIASTMIVGINLTHATPPGGAGPIPFVRMNLIGSKIVVRSESWLKIQNQTVSTLGGEEDEVDRIPILCNKYWGYGTGAFTNRLIQNAEAQLVQNQATGLITKVGTVASGLSEAPPRSYFTGCKSKRQFILAPGHFASSKAYFNTAVAIEKFWPMLASQYTSSTLINYYPYGSWNLFHFEHLIKPKATTSSLIVNGEVNFRTGCYLTCQKYHNTDERVETATYVTY